MAQIRIHSSILSAAAILAIGEKLVSVRWNETSKQTKREVAILVPMETVSAPEVPESFRALVEAALFGSAESVLKSFCEDNPNSFEIPLDYFDRDILASHFVSRGSNWLKKDELELQFSNSATWKRIAGRVEFSNNATYRAVANRFKDTIVKLSGKATVLSPDDCDAILSKLEDSDLSTTVGEFIVSRLDSMKKKKVEILDFNSL